MDRFHTCCFTGHRPEKLNVSEDKIKFKLKKAIKDAIKDGFLSFVSGMAQGVDICAAEIVLEEKLADSRISLICALPFDCFEKSRSPSEQMRYNKIINAADDTVCICRHYSKAAFHLRNRFMVDNSTRIICAYNGEKGGTKNTLSYAKKQSVEIVNVLDESFS